jgi:hypothetical protein
MKKSHTLESILFGGKEWKKASTTKFVFITDPEWTLLPFEVLPATNFEVLAEKFVVVRNIRSPQPVPEGKQGKGIVLWIQNHPHLKSTLQAEKQALETLFEEASIPFELYQRRDTLLPQLWINLSHSEYLHFAGHSEKYGIYISEKEILNHTDWEGQDLSNLSLAFMNTCHSGADRVGGDGLMRTLLKIGVREVLGFSNLVASEKGVVFSNLMLWLGF